ncbi:crossover junction endodeoxyribonuclease RuvC [Spirochaetia bacterium]|nr:crossover junction endodeoxyribonuclease RuvC [Spirochaetia bacterium]
MKTTSRRRIIGIDPGLASSGWGIIELKDNRVLYLTHGCIETAANVSHPLRLLEIYKEIRKVIKKWQPNESAIEKLYFARNAKSAMPVGEARGVLCMALAGEGLPIHELTPNAIKQAVTGVGSAEKMQVQDMTRIILGLTEIPKPDHAADALAAAICAANLLQSY